MKNKRWIVGLGLLLLLCVTCPAWAEGDPEVTEWLCGGWSSDTVGAPYAGLYFRMDGVCLTYEKLPSGEIVPYKTGTWYMDGGTVYVTVEGDPFPYPCILIPEQIWEGRVLSYVLEMHWYETIRYEAGGVVVPWEAAIPEAIRQDIAARYPGMTYEDSAQLPNTPDGMHCFVLLRDACQRRLLGCRYADGAWSLMADTRDGVPQTPLQAWLGHWARGELYLNLMTGGESGCDGLYYTEHGGSISVLTTDEESYVDSVHYMWRQDGYHLAQYTKRITSMVDIIDEVMVFTNMSEGPEGTGICTVETAIDRVDFTQLPNTLEEYYQLQEGRPLLDWFDEHSLLDRDVTFPVGRKYPVYTGPGTSYARAAGGKAAVSTNGWIQVFCEYNGMWLIQYELDEGAYRMGWIEAEPDASWGYMAQVDFSNGYMICTRQGLTLTDDPMGTRRETVQLDGTVRIHVMAGLNMDWLYVRAEAEDGIWWGFLPSDALSST